MAAIDRLARAEGAIVPPDISNYIKLDPLNLPPSYFRAHQTIQLQGAEYDKALGQSKACSLNQEEFNKSVLKSAEASWDKEINSRGKMALNPFSKADPKNRDYVKNYRCESETDSLFGNRGFYSCPDSRNVKRAIHDEFVNLLPDLFNPSDCSRWSLKCFSEQSVKEYSNFERFCPDLMNTSTCQKQLKKIAREMVPQAAFNIVMDREKEKYFQKLKAKLGSAPSSCQEIHDKVNELDTKLKQLIIECKGIIEPWLNENKITDSSVVNCDYGRLERVYKIVSADPKYTREAIELKLKELKEMSKSTVLLDKAEYRSKLVQRLYQQEGKLDRLKSETDKPEYSKFLEKEIQHEINKIKQELNSPERRLNDQASRAQEEIKWLSFIQNIIGGYYYEDQDNSYLFYSLYSEKVPVHSFIYRGYNCKDQPNPTSIEKGSAR